jgi:nitrous oxide reductase accessory protein NosL
MMAQKTIAKEMKMISKKRARKAYPMGKKIYMHKCDKKRLDKLVPLDVASLKQEILKEKICGKLKPMQLQMVALYAKFGNVGHFSVPKEAKCPVCGMFVAKYPKWAVQLTADGKKLYFDGVKDFFKYYLKYKKGDAVVKDFYSLTDINLKDAFLVKGSNIIGPMGHELIPFQSRKDAKIFMKEHKGKDILLFRDVSIKVIKSLDE